MTADGLLPAFSILDRDSMTFHPLHNVTRLTSQSPIGSSQSSCTYPWRKSPKSGPVINLCVCLQWAMRPSTGPCTEDIWSSTSLSRSSPSFMVTFPHACALCSASRTRGRPPSHPKFQGGRKRSSGRVSALSCGFNDPTAHSGDDGSNAENKFCIIRDVTIAGTLTITLSNQHSNNQTILALGQQMSQSVPWWRVLILLTLR